MLDAWSRRVVGWSLDRRPTAAMVNSALGMAVEARLPRRGTLSTATTARSSGSRLGPSASGCAPPASLTHTAAELLSLRPPRPSDADPLAWWWGLRTGAVLRRARAFRADADLALGWRSSLDAGLDELERDAVAHGDALPFAVVALYRSFLALSDGRFGQVESTCERAQAAMQRAWGPEVADYTRVHHLFRLRLEQGRLAEFENELVTAMERHPHAPTLRPMLALVWAQTGRTDDARREIGAILATGAAAYTDAHADWEDPIWLTLVADLCGRVDDVVGAASVYDRLRPYAGVFPHPAFGPLQLGAADHFLGVLAVTLGRRQDADAHLGDALGLEDAMGARPLVARTRYWRARMLSRRRPPGDAEAAGAILAEVSATTAELGMLGLEREVEALSADLGA